MDEFTEIKDEKQLNNFLDEIWNFHDGVISKIEYVSGSSGSKDGTYPIDKNPRILLRIEGCNYNETTIDGVELLFEGLIKAFISPIERNFTTNIFEANIILKNHKFVFVSDIDDDVNEINTNQSGACYVMAEKLSYRLFQAV